jgi:hypothetical protein
MVKISNMSLECSQQLSHGQRSKAWFSSLIEQLQRFYLKPLKNTFLTDVLTKKIFLKFFYFSAYFS